MKPSDPSEKIDSGIELNKSVRRKFLQRATIGAAIATIPGRTAWAGLVNSIVASAQGSEFSTDDCLQVLSPGYWRQDKESRPWIGVARDAKFKDVFGGLRFVGTDDGSTPKAPHKNDTLDEILNQPGNNNMGGPSNVNFHMVGMYLNGAHHGSYGVYFPVLQIDGGPFATLSDYADYLYTEASKPGNAGNVGAALSQIVDEYHLGSGTVCSTNT